MFSVYLCLVHPPGSVVVWALPQLELNVGSSPEAWHFASDVQHPRSACRCRSILPCTQQRWHRPAWHQHLQSFCRLWLPHWGWSFSQLHFLLCQFRVYMSYGNHLLIYTVFVFCFSSRQASFHNRGEKNTWNGPLFHSLIHSVECLSIHSTGLVTSELCLCQNQCSSFNVVLLF